MNLRLNLSLLLFALPSLIFAQLTTPDIRDQFAKTITAGELKAHLSFLADDLLEGRETGTRGQQVAALYIRSMFMKAGLPGGVDGGNSYFQPYNVVKYQIDDATFSSGKTNYSYPEAFFFGLEGTPAQELNISAWQFVGYGLSTPAYDNLKGLKLDSTLAVAVAGSPNAKPQNLRAAQAAWKTQAADILESGAAAVALIIPDSAYSVFRRYARRSSMRLVSPTGPTRPVFYFSEKMGAELLANAGADLAEVKTQLATSPALPGLKYKKAPLSYSASVVSSSMEASNVVAFLEGSERPDEIIAITGHYDHIGITNGVVNNGADDDGSGTSAVMEIAEAFSLAAQAGHRPKRSLLFMTVSGEEKGLWGSEFYTDNPIFPIKNTVADLNIDMIGRVGDEYKGKADSLHYVYLIGSDRLSQELHEISEEVNKATENLTLDYKYNDPNDPNRFYTRSDHYNFARFGVPVIFYFNGTHEDYHMPTDDVFKIQFGKMETIARLVFGTAWELANRPERIQVNK